jgi:FkbM family methyltransferase
MIQRLWQYIRSRLGRIWKGLPAAKIARYIRQKRIEDAHRKRHSLIVQMPHLNGSKMLLHPENYFAGVYARGSYESHLVKYLNHTIQSDMICSDVGANIGYFTLLMASLTRPAGRVISFEPTRSTFEMLQENVKLNGLQNVLTEQLALSDFEGEINFNEGPAGFEVYNTAGMVTHPNAVHHQFNVRVIQCCTLDTYLEKQGIQRIDLIKIDVEGAEFSVLRGMENTLKNNPQLRLVIEFANQTTAGFGYQAQDMGFWLQKRGWILSVIESDGHLTRVSPERDWIGEIVVASR